jgi:AsmA protein
MARRALTFLFSTLCLAMVLALAGAILASRYLDGEDFKEDLTRALSGLTGRTVSIDGRLHLDFRPWLALSAENVSLGQPPGFGPGPMVQARRVSLTIESLPLLARTVIVSQVYVDGLVLDLSMAPDGRANWEGMSESLSRVGATATGERTRLTGRMDLKTLTLEHAQVRYQDQGRGLDLSFSGVGLSAGHIRPGAETAFLLNATLNHPAIKWPLAATAQARLGMRNNTPALALDRVDLRTLTPLTPQDPSPGRASLIPDYRPAEDALCLRNATLEGLGLSVSGQACLTGLSGRPALNATFRTGNFTPGRLVRALAPNSTLALAAQHFNSARLAARLAATNASLALDGLHLALDQFTLDGSAEVENFRRPKIALDLKTPSLDLDALSAKAFPARDHKSHEPPSWAFWRELSGTGRLTAGELTAGGLKAREVALTAQANTGTILLKVDQAKALGGRLKAQAGLDLPGSRKGLERQMAARLVLDLEGGEAAPLLEALNLPPSLSGRLDASARLSAQGTDFDALPRAANGSVAVKAQQAQLSFKPEKGQPARPPLSLSQAQARLWLTPLPAPASAGHGTRDPESYRARTALEAWAALDSRDGRAPQRWAAQAAGEAEYTPKGHGLTLRGATLNLGLEDGFLPQSARRATLSGQGDLDFGRGTATLRRGALKALGLEAEIEGSGQDLWLPTPSAKGSVRINRANPRDLLAFLDASPGPASDPKALRSLTARADFALAQNRTSFTNLSATLDDTPIKGEAGFLGFDHPLFTFNLEAGDLDLDRYRPAKPKEEDAPKPAQTPPSPPAKSEPEPAPDEPLQLDTLRNLNLDGSLSLSRLKYRDLVWTGLSARLKARRGLFEFAPVKAGFYGGRYECGVRGEVTAFLLKSGVNIRITGFQAGPFLEAMAGKDYVRGTTDMYYDLETAGATDMDILRNLTGRAGFTITKGSYKFFGYDQRQAPPAEAGDIGAMSGSQPSEQRTVFDSARATFKVSQGVFANDDLALQGLLVEGTGKGSFSLPADSINYTLSMNLMHATNMPVRLSGKLSDPDVSVPKGELLVDTVKDVLDIPLKPLRFLKDILLPQKKVLKSSPPPVDPPAEPGQ